MESLLLSIHPSDPLWIALAFACGLALRMIGLPPLIGFLAAGFILNALGAKGGEFLSRTADLGITLLLFSIGLKLKLRTLARPEVLGVATLHMAMITLAISAWVFFLASVGLSFFSGLNVQQAVLIGFVMSFSSTVFAIKILDELGASNSKHGKVSIGILVIQDIAAVIFLAISTQKIPSIWAICLLGLIPLRHVLFRILEKTGHGELLVLFGISVALVGADIFELVGLKGDLGALILGMLLAGHAKSKELAKALFSFKELFLVGFFLSVGMTATPTWESVGVAALFLLLLPVKAALFFTLFNQFSLRASTSWRASLNLVNYSEFGLIVGALAVSTGWLDSHWIVVFALALAFSFILSAPLANIRDDLYQRWRHKLKSFQKEQRLDDEADINLNHKRIMILGMGRMGSSAYHALMSDFEDKLIGIELDPEKAFRHQSEQLQVIPGDVTNPDFWIRTADTLDNIQWILLTLSTHQGNKVVAQKLIDIGFKGKIAATSKYPDEEAALKDIGVSWTFNIYSEAGLGFANEIKGLVD